MHRTAKVAIATLVSCAVVIGCGQGAVSSTDFSDRQIFEGVMFGAGPVANLVPEARDHLRPELYTRNDAELGAMTQARAILIDAVDRAEPDLLAAFAAAARSGDPARIQPMLARATSALSGASANARTPNLPVDTRTPNLPVDTRTPNLPVDTRTPNLPVDTRTPNLPVDTRTPNLPVDTRTPNLPVDTRTPNLPVDTRTPNLPVDTRTPNLPVDTRTPNLPVDTRTPNLPVDTRTPNLPVDTRTPNLPVDTRTPNLPVDTRTPNLPVDTRTPNLPVDIRATGISFSSAAPAWRLFSNQLFTEQLAMSVAGTFGATAAGR